jgi:23S rRNA pseudouridine1911/1915/1917 synthase
MNLLKTVPTDLGGQRLDQVLVRLWPEYSRARWAKHIKEGKVCLDQVVCTKASGLVAADQELDIEPFNEQRTVDLPEDRVLDIVYEDEAVIVINKPAGLSVHPGAGQANGTLLNALLHHHPALAQLPRAGIVHRLDKDTTGLLVVSKDQAAYDSLVSDLAKRRIKRLYEALACGIFISPESVIDALITRDPKHRTRMAVMPHGKAARTHYRVLGLYQDITHLSVALETGRTHQIRVHLAHIQHPVLGDPTYGGVRKGYEINRQALHAQSLGFYHPRTKEWCAFSIPLAPDFQAVLNKLKGAK